MKNLGSVTNAKDITTKEYVDGRKVMWYATCPTAAGTAAKVATTSTGDFVLATGNMVRVTFDKGNSFNGTATLNVDGKGAVDIVRVGTTKTVRYYWVAGETVDFVYDGTNFAMSAKGTATTTYYGLTKLVTSATSSSEALALTPLSLRNLVGNMVSDAPVFSSSANYAVGDLVRYNYQTWRCTTAHNAAAWDATHFTPLDPLQTQVNAKQDKISSVAVSLVVANWSSNSQTVTATGVTASNTVILSPDPNSCDAYLDAEIRCMSQGTNSLTFTCTTTPSSAIGVNVVIIN